MSVLDFADTFVEYVMSPGTEANRSHAAAARSLLPKQLEEDALTHIVPSMMQDSECRRL